jgi:pantoate--beta-alanine ligase
VGPDRKGEALRILASPHETRHLVQEACREGKKVGFVPTMGALHEGHLSLARKAKQENDLCVMSIFVNPTQFGPQEDLAAYPRPFEKDRTLAEGAGVDLLFSPRQEDMYPPGHSTYVEETSISQCLCGAHRPGHFRGVCTVVLKLFQTVPAHRAYFGRKDAQQLRIIEKMAQDLDLDIRIVGCPTVREKDGLAMSSRNVYLSPEEREEAPVIFAALQEAERAFQRGERSAEKLLAAARRTLSPAKRLTVQYLELRRWRDFELAEDVTETSLLAFAGFCRRTRLIDNVLLTP